MNLNRVAIYARKSPSDTDEQVGVDGQIVLCREEADRRGWPVVAVFTDVAKSAFEAQYREGYESLCALIAAGGCDAVLIRHNDRLHRDLGEYKAFEKQVRKAGVKVVAVLGGDWAIETAQGRFSGAMMAAVGEYESAVKQERIEVGIMRRVTAGLPAHTRHRPYGFEADGITHRPEEVENLREFSRKYLAGTGTLAEGARLTGKTPTGFRKLLLSPRMVGCREYKGKLYQAVWEPVLDRGVWDALRVALEARSVPAAPRRHLLTGLLRCGVEGCGRLLIASQETRSKAVVYKCPAFHVVRRASRLDEYVRDRVLDAVTTLGQRPQLGLNSDEADTLSEIRTYEARLAEIEERMSDPQGMPLEVLTRAYAAGMARLEELKASLSLNSDEAFPVDPAPELWGETLGVWQAWWDAEERTLGERRALIETVVRVVWVYKTPKGRLPFDEGGVFVEPR